MRIVNQIGNTILLKRSKTLFICSKHTPIGYYGRVFAWVDGLMTTDSFRARLKKLDESGSK